MIDGSVRVEFTDVEVTWADSVIVMCRIGKKIVAVLPRQMLAGTEIGRAGDRGRLVLSREAALNLGLT